MFSVPMENAFNSYDLFELLNGTAVQQNSIIEDQNNIIKSIKVDLAEIKQEQRILRTQNTELQEEVCSLRAQLETLSTLPPSTQTWASIAAGEYPAEAGIASSRTANTGTIDKNKDYNREPSVLSRASLKLSSRCVMTSSAKIEPGLGG
jgi:hypothetical protein